jgi:acetyl esterase/lipase
MLEGRVLLSVLAAGARPSIGPRAVAEFLVNRQVRSSGPGRMTPSNGGHRWIIHRDIPYGAGPGAGERLDVYLPRGPIPPGGRPVLIAIHGGGWRRFDKTGYGERIAGAFVDRGYIVVAPNYELSSPARASWPVNLGDVQQAVSWVRAHAAELGINPGHVAAIGESAGANLAALLGTDPGPAGAGPNSDRVDAVVAFSAPLDLPALYAESPIAARAVAQFLGGSPHQVRASYAAASPIDHVAPGDPPMLLVHGARDPLVPASQSEMMAAALATAGVRSRLILVRGGHELDFPARYAKLVPRVLEFLNTTWKDE